MILWQETILRMRLFALSSGLPRSFQMKQKRLSQSWSCLLSMFGWARRNLLRNLWILFMGSIGLSLSGRSFVPSMRIGRGQAIRILQFLYQLYGAGQYLDPQFFDTRLFRELLPQ
jgi:hypothetical protein